MARQRQIAITEMTASQKIATYLEKKSEVEKLKKELKALEESIQSGMGEAAEIRENGFVARFEYSTQRKFDTTRFKAEHLDVYEAYRHDVAVKSFKAYVEA